MAEVCLKKGYLIKAPDVAKHLHNFKKWQRKWFKLDSNGDLYYYDNEKTAKPAGVIYMSQCYRIFEGKSKGIQLSYCCGLEVNSNTYFLKSESATAFNEWVKLLSEYAEVCDVVVDPVGERHGTLSAEDMGEKTWRSGSVQSRHFSFSTQTKFLTKEGWLAKTGSNNKGWRDRYFKLHHAKLLYFKNDKVDTPQGDIDLFLCSSIEKTAGKKGFGLDLHIPGRVFNMSADNEVDQGSWISVIKDTLDQIREINDHESTSASLRRSGSNNSNISGSSSKDLAHQEREERSPSFGSDQTTLRPLQTLDRLSVSPVRSIEDLSHSGNEELKPDSSFSGPTEPSASTDDHKDGVVQLLEAEVDALRNKVTSIQSDMKASTAVNSQLHQQLSEVKTSQENREKELTEEKNQLLSLVGRLENAKQELENINDSVTAQLEAQLERVLELEEDVLVARNEVDESQAAYAAVEEELAETQQRLQEIEQVARELESALRKRESEPPTPLTSNFRSLGLPYQPHIDSEDIKLSQRLTKTIVDTAAEKLKTSSNIEHEELRLMDELRKKLSILTEENLLLKQQLKTQQHEPNTPVTSEGELIESSSSNKSTGCPIEEERLKWQMKMENLRRELNSSFNSEKEKLTAEKIGMQAELKLLQEKVTKFEFQNGSRNKEHELEQKLIHSEKRILRLQKDIDSYQGKLTQLQVEKEKALADLITIRKANKSIEKRMSETEELRISSPITSLSAINSLPDSPPDVFSTITDLERKVEVLKTALSEVEKERDMLKLKVDRLSSGLQKMPEFRFKNKSGASVASNNISTSANHSSLVSNSSNSSLESGINISNQEAPPKPQRPPSELVHKVKQNTAEVPPSIENDSLVQLRSRTTTLLQSLFPQRR